MNRNVRPCFQVLLGLLTAVVGTLGVGCMSPDSPRQTLDAPLRAELSTTPCPGEDAIVAGTRAAIARVRAMAGLPALHCTAEGSAAAHHHCAYAAANKELGHAEVEGRPEFTGVDVWHRLAVQGFRGEVAGEVISSLVDAAAIYDDGGLMNTVYHRMIFLRSTTGSMGIGYDGSCTTIDFGRRDEATVGEPVVWPPNGATGVPTTFFADREYPSPLPGRHAVGAPVSLLAGEELADLRATLTGPDGLVDVEVLSPEGDPTGLIHPGDAHIVARSPLKSNAEYTARFVARAAGGRVIDLTSTFRTVTE